MGEKQYGIDEKRLAEYAEQIKEIHQQGVQIGIVIGGGNIFRGLSGANKGFDRVKGGCRCDTFQLLKWQKNGMYLNVV